MGNAAGSKLRVLDNVERTLAIELLAGTQAIEFLAPLALARGCARCTTPSALCRPGWSTIAR
jgi:histidine ammonia-lyase